ncbi:MAG TPA: cupin domain-containing protein, partial [Thermoanaerobaculia bacterium]|nr:cupin domain-containing protein [Thermoanaerobaculia bacterium]
PTAATATARTETATAPTTREPSFADLVGEDFLTRVWGRTYAVLPGTPGRFHSLLSWSEVNGMLQKHRLEPPRLRLVRGGSFAAKSDFLRYEGNRIPFVVPEKLSQHLRDGYTLVIDAVDDMTDGVMRMAEELERVVQEGVQVNLYAGWREQQGFNRHCDTHDVIVLQLYGKKYWRVYEGGRPHPLKDDVAPNDELPQKVVWEGLLQDGDALYLPRGWWHEASGVGEVTLHLTFGIHQRTGLNLMHWMADQLRASTEFRAPLQRFASAEQQQAQLAELRRQVAAMFDDDLLARYYAHQNSRARSRGWANLPWSVEEQAAPPMETRIALAAPRELNLVQQNGSVSFDANGRAWTFAATTAPLLRTLARGPATVAELCSAAEGALDGAAVQQFVTELARQGLVRIETGA